MRIPFAAVQLLLAGAVQAQVIRFEALDRAYPRVNESAGAVVIGVVREGSTDSESKVSYALEEADPGFFAPLAGQLIFAPGERRHDLTVIILDNAYPNYSAVATIVLGKVQGATLLPNGQRTKVVVLDNEFERLNTQTAPVECYPPWPAARSDGNSAQFTLRRLGVSDQPLTVNLTTADQTAKAGVHYVAQSLSVTFAPLETEKPIAIPLLNGPMASRDLTLELIFSRIEGGKPGEIYAVYQPKEGNRHCQTRTRRV